MKILLCLQLVKREGVCLVINIEIVRERERENDEERERENDEEREGQKVRCVRY